MFEPGDKVVLGFSGGADPAALLHIKNAASSPISAVCSHVNHGLRGHAAREDAEFGRIWQKYSFFLKK